MDCVKIVSTDSKRTVVQQSIQTLDILRELFIQRGVPVYIRSDNGAEFTAKRCAKLTVKATDQAVVY